MASKYGYIDITDLEDYACKTYANLMPSYSTDQVDAKITTAERIINEICGKKFTGTIPDGVIVATTLMAERLMTAQMIKDGHSIEFKKTNEEFVDYIVNTVLKSNHSFQIQSFEWYPD